MEYCGPCTFRSQNTRAIKFCINCQELQCKTCAEIHKSSKATRNHLLMPSAELNKQSRTNKDLEKYQRCNDHQEKPGDYYCIDHKHILCSTCLLNIQKRNCKAIVEIEAAGEHLMQCDLKEKIETDLENTIDHCKDEVSKILNMKETSKRNRKDIQSLIGEMRHKLITAFDICGKEILDGIDTNLKEQTLSLTTAEESLTKTLQTAEENKNMLQAITSNGSKADVFRSALSISQQLNEVREAENNLSTKLFTHSLQLSPAFQETLETTGSLLQCKTEVTSMKFSCSGNHNMDTESFLDSAIQTVLNKDSNLSDDYTCSSADAETEETRRAVVDMRPVASSQNHESLTDRENKLASSAANVDQNNKSDDKIKIVHAADINVSTPDGKEPVIVDVITLNDGCLVISDSRWTRLIRLNKDLTNKDETVLSHPPGNMTTLDDKFLVVCLTKVSRIAFVTVLVEFKWMRNFITKYPPKDVHAIDKKHLLVSMYDKTMNQWFLHLLNTDGALMQVIGNSVTLQSAQKISSLKITSSITRYYLLCCKKSNALFCIGANGTERFKHEILSPNGIYVDSKGRVFVLGFFGVLHVLSQDGKLLQIIDIQGEVSGITSSKGADRLFISRCNAPTISVFTIIR